MNDCDVCGFPMVWSAERLRAWCSIHGDHAEQHPAGECQCASCLLQRERWARARET